MYYRSSNKVNNLQTPFFLVKALWRHQIRKYLLDQDYKVDYKYEKLEKFDGSQIDQTRNA